MVPASLSSRRVGVHKRSRSRQKVPPDLGVGASWHVGLCSMSEVLGSWISTLSAVVEVVRRAGRGARDDGGGIPQRAGAWRWDQTVNNGRK